MSIDHEILNECWQISKESNYVIKVLMMSSIMWKWCGFNNWCQLVSTIDVNLSKLSSYRKIYQKFWKIIIYCNTNHDKNKNCQILMTPIVKKSVITWQVMTQQKNIFILGKIAKFHTYSLSSSNCSRGVICSTLVEIGLTNYSTCFFLYNMFFL